MFLEDKGNRRVRQPRYSCVPRSVCLLLPFEITSVSAGLSAPPGFAAGERIKQEHPMLYPYRVQDLANRTQTDREQRRLNCGRHGCCDKDLARPAFPATSFSKNWVSPPVRVADRVASRSAGIGSPAACYLPSSHNCHHCACWVHNIRKT